LIEQWRSKWEQTLLVAGCGGVSTHFAVNKIKNVF